MEGPGWGTRDASFPEPGRAPAEKLRVEEERTWQSPCQPTLLSGLLKFTSTVSTGK